MRRILFPLLVIGLAGGLFTLGSGAFFSDTETDTGNTITAGTLDLTLGTTAGGCDYSGVAPDQTLAACAKTLNMAGNLDNLVLAAKLAAPGTGCTPALSTEFCDGNADLVAGDLLVTACTYDGGACPFGAVIVTTTLQDFITAGCVTLDADADAADDNKTLSITLKVKDTTPNNRQGDSISVDYTFALTQSTFAGDRCAP